MPSREVSIIFVFVGLQTWWIEPDRAKCAKLKGAQTVLLFLNTTYNAEYVTDAFD